MATLNELLDEVLRQVEERLDTLEPRSSPEQLIETAMVSNRAPDLTRRLIENERAMTIRCKARYLVTGRWSVEGRPDYSDYLHFLEALREEADYGPSGFTSDLNAAACSQGHPFTPRNTRLRELNGHTYGKFCRECARAYQRNRRQSERISFEVA